MYVLPRLARTSVETIATTETMSQRVHMNPLPIHKYPVSCTARLCQQIAANRLILAIDWQIFAIYEQFLVISEIN